MDRRSSPAAASELQALLRKRLRIVEGGPSAAITPPIRQRATIGSVSSSHYVHHPPQRIYARATGSGPVPLSVHGAPGRTPHGANGVVGSANGASITAAQGPQLRVHDLELKNEQLTAEVERLRGRRPTDPEDERLHLIAVTDQLMAERDRMVAAERKLSQRQQDIATIQRLTDEVAALRDHNATLSSEAAAATAAAAATVASRRERLQSSVGSGCEASAAGRCAEEALRAEVALLRAESQRLAAEASEFRGRAEAAEAASAAAAKDAAGEGSPTASATPSSCSGCRLRATLTRQGAGVEELRQAISAVEALVDEARRELATKQLRERRAAFEELHGAIEKGNDESALANAIDAARGAGVEQEDLQKAEDKLAELRALTPEERERRAKAEREAKVKKEAYLLVKKDDADGLTALIEGLDESVQWQDWRDYAGRTMRRCAQELRAGRAEKVLVARAQLKVPDRRPTEQADVTAPRSGPLCGAPAQREQAPKGDRASEQAASVALTAVATAADGTIAPATVEAPGAAAVAAVAGRSPSDIVAAEALPQQQQPLPTPPDSTFAEHPAAAAATVAARSVLVGEATADSVSPEDLPVEEDLARPRLDCAEEAKLKAKALRAVVQDDCAALSEVLDCIPTDVWSGWQNKAGKDLITLSQERGSSSAYSLLAKALGLVKEVRREAFEEREDIWVFVAGNVQPKRATVLEDTPEEADLILIAYWDGDDPPERVDRCTVRKMWS